MDRRKFITAASTIGVTAIAGCLGSNSGGSGTTQEDLDVEVEFTMDGDDLVAKHTGGDVLPSGQQVLLTVAGDQVVETTVSEDVRVGGEIIRAENVNSEDEYVGTKLVGLYTEQGGSEVELASTEVDIPPKYDVPNAQLNWDYDATNENLAVYHDGGQVISSNNTQQLRISNVSGQDLTVNAPAWGSGLSQTGTTTTDEDQATVTGSIQAGDRILTLNSFSPDGSVDLAWVASDGTSVILGSFEGPSA